jgi:hypothetical protein
MSCIKAQHVDVTGRQEHCLKVVLFFFGRLTKMANNLFA